MKVFIALAVVFGVVAIAQAMSAEEKSAMKAKLAAECKAKEDATDADVQILMVHGDPTTKSAKCLAACVLETVGIIKDNKPDRDAAIALTKMGDPGNDKALEMVNNIHNDCGGVSDADRCELAGKLWACSNDSLIKQGIDPKTLTS